MSFATKILKVTAFIIGTLSFAYGFILGVLGSGPDGPHNSIYIRIIGIYVLALGACYILSNKSKLQYEMKYHFFMFFELTPLIVIIVTATYSIADEGMASFIELGGLTFLWLAAALSIVSPVSLLLAKRLKTSNQRVYSDAR